MSDIRIVAEIEVKPEYRDELLPVLKELVDKSRAESANKAYDLVENLEKPAHFFVLETWSSQEGIDEHNGTAHFQAFVAAIQGKVDKLSITKLKEVF